MRSEANLTGVEILNEAKSKYKEFMGKCLESRPEYASIYVENQYAFRDSVISFFAGWVECMVFYGKIEHLMKLKFEFAVMSDLDWLPDDSWKFW